MSENSKENPKASKRGRKKGCKKPEGSGRKKGTRNRNSSTFREALDKQGFDLVKEYIKGLSELEGAYKLIELRYLIKFLYPVLKESEVKVEPEAPENEPKDPLSNVDTKALLSIVSPPKK